MHIERVGVIGAGTMGNGIAQACAAAGIDVVMVDVAQAAVDRGLAAIDTSLERLQKKERTTGEARKAALARVAGTTDYAKLGAAQLVVEAATENLELKLRILKQVDGLARAGTIIASNTSSISITQLAAVTSRPAQFVGMHFFNPVPMMALVEVVRGKETSDETAEAITALAVDLGKTPAVANDFPGFVSNRILMPYLNEAVWALHDGVAEPEAIDTIAKLGFAHPMGPLALADLIGLDTCVAIMEVLRDGLDDDRYEPCPLLRELVSAGKLGRKSGAGFYIYS
jgi:3-hydroxybutyryl-CoA dehydrogenase